MADARQANREVIQMQPIQETSVWLLRELVSHLRQARTELLEQWAQRITEASVLTAMTKEEIFAEATAVYDNYMDVLETGAVEALQAYARNLSERIIPRGVETHEVVALRLESICMCLRVTCAAVNPAVFPPRLDLAGEIGYLAR